MMRMEQHTETRKCEPFYPVNQVSKEQFLSNRKFLSTYLKNSLKNSMRSKILQQEKDKITKWCDTYETQVNR